MVGISKSEDSFNSSIKERKKKLSKLPLYNITNLLFKIRIIIHCLFELFPYLHKGYTEL
jgi:hypothetical protein